MCWASSLVWHKETQTLFVIAILSQRQGDELTDLLHIATLSDPLRRPASPNIRLGSVPTGLRISVSPSRTPLPINVIVTGIKILRAGNGSRGGSNIVRLSSYYVEFGDKTVAFYKGAVYFWFRPAAPVSRGRSRATNSDSG